MRRLTALLLVLVADLAAATGAAAKPKVFNASSWKGKLIVVVDGYDHHEHHEPGVEEIRRGHAHTVMSGKTRHILLPYKYGKRHWTLGGGGSLQQLTSRLNGSFTSVDSFHNLKWTCQGGFWNQGRRDDTMQFRTEIGFSGSLVLEVDGFSMRPGETCEPAEGFSTQIQQDGWPDPFVYGLSRAPQSQRKLELMADWWTWSHNCGLGDEREGSGGPPGDVRQSSGDERCVSGRWIHIQTLLDLKRKCKKVRVRATASSARERCVQRK